MNSATKVGLSLSEKVTLMNNRLGAFMGLGYMADSHNNKTLSHHPDFSIDSLACRQYYGVCDDRTPEEMVADVEALWEEIKAEVYSKIEPHRDNS